MSETWRNWARTAASDPTRWHRPTTEAQVVRAVLGASRLKVVGAGHSFSPIALPEGEVMTLDGLAGLVHLEDGLATVRGGTRLRDLSSALLARGWTLPIVGSIQAQSVAGAIATGTHGSSLTHGNLASLVTRMRLVDGTGGVRELTEPGPRVHLGALGVVTELTLRVEPAFRLRQVIEHVPVDDVDLAEAAGSAEYVKVWWLPHARAAQVVRYTRTSDAPTARPSTKTLRWIDDNVMHRAAFPAMVALQHRFPGLVPGLNRMLERSYLGPREQVANSSFILNTPMPMRHRETEAAIPLTKATEAFHQVVELVRRERIAANFPVEARFVPADEAWLSPAYGGDTCQLGAYTTDGPDCDRYFRGFLELMRPLGARPHWGKELDHTSAEIATAYPRVKDFQQLRDELDPERVFDNAFLRQVL